MYLILNSPLERISIINSYANKTALVLINYSLDTSSCSSTHHSLVDNMYTSDFFCLFSLFCFHKQAHVSIRPENANKDPFLLASMVIAQKKKKKNCFVIPYTNGRF